jgi:hypothetical protein
VNGLHNSGDEVNASPGHGTVSKYKMCGYVCMRVCKPYKTSLDYVRCQSKEDDIPSFRL